MSEPLSADRLAEMRERAEQESYAANVLADDVIYLLAEVDRLEMKVARKHVAARRAQAALLARTATDQP